MIPSRLMMDRVRSLLKSDTGSIAHATNAVHVCLITNDFTPTPSRVMGDLTKCTVTGLTGITGVAGDQLESIDPLTSEDLVEIKAPAGGWRWECTDATGLPVTIRGIALTDSTEAVLLGCAKFEDPITINAVNQSITLPEVVFAIDASKIH